MKKIAISVILAVVLVGLLTTPILAKDLEKGKSAMSGKSDTGHLYLFEKNPADWSLVVDGAWGKFSYKLSIPDNLDETAVSGVFNGHGLEPGLEYSLIYYTEPDDELGLIWPRDIVALGTGTVNEGGNIHITGEGTIGKPDAHIDPNDVDYQEQTGDKIWLVLTADIVKGAEGEPDVISGWNPADYLFEYRLINTGTP